jgi:hypothetical protein
MLPMTSAAPLQLSVLPASSTDFMEMNSSGWPGTNLIDEGPRSGILVPTANLEVLEGCVGLDQQVVAMLAFVGRLVKRLVRHLAREEVPAFLIWMPLGCLSWRTYPDSPTRTSPILR